MLYCIPVVTVEAAPGDGPSRMAPSAIRAGHYLAPDGTLKTGGTIVLRQGKIQSIRPSNEGRQEHEVDHTDAVVVPGLIDVRSAVGAYRHNVESVHAVDPGAAAHDAIDWRHRQLSAALRAGVTTVVVAPAGNNLISGSAAVIKTGQPRGSSVTLKAEGPMQFALSPSVWQRDRAPTSRGGSVHMMRQALDAARAGEGHVRLQSFVREKGQGMIVVGEPADMVAALQLFADHAGPLAMLYQGDNFDYGSALAEQKRTVVLGPFTFDTPIRRLMGASTLAAEGVPVVLAGGTPHVSGDGLRVTASLAVRYGLDAATARRAITVEAARVAGVGDRVGSIAPGQDADLVILSHDPLRLDARVLEVYINGVRVYVATDAARAAARSSQLEESS